MNLNKLNKTGARKITETTLWRQERTNTARQSIQAHRKINNREERENKTVCDGECACVWMYEREREIFTLSKLPCCWRQRLFRFFLSLLYSLWWLRPPTWCYGSTCVGGSIVIEKAVRNTSKVSCYTHI